MIKLGSEGLGLGTTLLVRSLPYLSRQSFEPFLGAYDTLRLAHFGRVFETFRMGVTLVKKNADR